MFVPNIVLLPIFLTYLVSLILQFQVMSVTTTSPTDFSVFFVVLYIPLCISVTAVLNTVWNVQRLNLSTSFKAALEEQLLT